MGRSLNYKDAKGAYQLLGDMNEAEFNTLIQLNVFRIYYHTENDEYGLYVEPEAIQDAADTIIKAEPFDPDLMLLFFRIATWPQQGAFLLW